VQGKAPRYPIELRADQGIDQGMVEALASHEPSIPDSAAPASATGTSRDPLVSEGPAEGQSSEVSRDFGTDPVSRMNPISGTDEASQDIVSA